MSVLLVRLDGMRGPLFACSFVAVFVAGCPQEPPVAPTGPGHAATPPAADAADGGTAAPAAKKESATPEAREVGPLCGCGLCAPVVSDDVCNTDADCAPAVPCHADRCVAKAKAQPRKPDTACTMNLLCNTVDANTCGCHQGKCALMPRVKT
jgi:hypothetical protein